MTGELCQPRTLSAPGNTVAGMTDQQARRYLRLMIMVCPAEFERFARLDAEDKS